MNIFKRLCGYLAYKERLMKRIIEAEDDVEAKVFYALEKVESLDQSKVYAIKIGDNSTFEEVKSTKRILSTIQSRMKWNMPQFLICNRDISEVSIKELEAALKNLKRGK